MAVTNSSRTLFNPIITGSPIETFSTIAGGFNGSNLTVYAMGTGSQGSVGTPNIGYGSTVWFTGNATANGTINITGTTGSTLNSLVNVGQQVTVTVMITNGTTAYSPTALTIDGGSGTTFKRSPYGNAVITSGVGNASAVDIYVFTLIKTADSAWLVLASQTTWK
jgi:hypothetical protein